METSMQLFRTIDQINVQDYIIATYKVVATTSLRDAAWNIAVGQSVGNPNVRNQWETDELFEKHSCMILHDEKDLVPMISGHIQIAFPVANTNFHEDGISHLICQFMGGQVDIAIVETCQLVRLEFPGWVEQQFIGPKYGITGMRKFTGQYGKPLLGAIIKPKTGISPSTLLDMTKELVEGGVDFIKEDEILASPGYCPLNVRVPLIMNYLNNQPRKVVFSFCINADPHMLMKKVDIVANGGGNGVHLNVWCGLGAYNSVRQANKDLFIHFQKSGDKVFTHAYNNYRISWEVMCQLAGMMGVDTIHAGMIGGYSNDDPAEMEQVKQILHARNVLPALSCGMNPAIVGEVTKVFGVDYLANVGGGIHGHPSGTLAGAKAMRQAIDHIGGPEYDQAIALWGKK